jgi:hypothetical protein
MVALAAERERQVELAGLDLSGVADAAGGV